MCPIFRHLQLRSNSTCFAWVQMHCPRNLNVRGTWSMHGLNACYACPAMQHYRGCEVHVTKTFPKRVWDTITFLPHDISMPLVVNRNLSLARIEDLIKLLSNEAKPLPFLEHHDPSLVALQQLSEILTPASTPPSIVKKQPYVSTYKAPRVPDRPTLNPAHAQQLPRVTISPTTNNHRCPLDPNTHPPQTINAM